MAVHLRRVIGDAAKISAYRCGLFPDARQITSPLKRLELAAALAILEVKPGAIVLDLCCGSGLPALIIARTGAHVIGIDIDPQQIADAAWHRHYSRVGRRVELLCADAHALPLQDAMVDACISLCAIEHLTAADSACREVHRVLRPNGLFVLTADSLGSVPPSFPRNQHAARYGVTAYYSRVSLTSLLERSGFIVECCRPILRSPLATEELLTSMSDVRTNVLTAGRRRRRLAAAEEAASGEVGLFMLAAARKAR